MLENADLVCYSLTVLFQFFSFCWIAGYRRSEDVELKDTSTGLFLLFHPYLVLWILLSMHSELLVGQAHLHLAASVPSYFPPEMPFPYVLNLYSFLKAQLIQLRSVLFSSGGSLSVILFATAIHTSWFLSLIAFNLVFCCTAYICLFWMPQALWERWLYLLCHWFSLEYQVPTLNIVGEISQWVLEVIFLVTHTFAMSITINNLTLSLRRFKGLAFWQFAFLVANPSPFPAC